MGVVCDAFHDENVRGLAAPRIQCAEIWSIVGCEEKNRKRGANGHGAAWTWTAIDADSKLVLSYMIGLRGAGYATEFMMDVADRLVNRVQFSTDGLGAYLQAVPDAFGDGIDFAQLVKIYGPPPNPKNPSTPL